MPGKTPVPNPARGVVSCERLACAVASRLSGSTLTHSEVSNVRSQKSLHPDRP